MQLRGGDFNRAHGTLDLITKRIFKKARMLVSVQPSHIFHGKVPGPEIKQYTDLHSNDAITPDIMVHKFPLKDVSVASLKREAIFDVKTLRVDKAG